MKTPGTTLRTFLVIACTLGGASAQEAEQTPTRVYDVRDIVRREPGFLPAPVVDASFVPVANDTTEDARAALEIADLASAVKCGTAMSYWEREGVELRAEDTGFLSVTCNEAMHASVRSVLARLRGLLFEPVLVEVHELPGTSLGKYGSVLSAAEADALLAEAGAHRVHVGRTDPRNPLLLEAKRIQNRIAGLHMLVAQNAAAPDLMLTTDNYGASWMVRAARTIGDAMLITVSGSERTLEPGPARELPTNDEGKVATLELPVTRIATCHASSYLRPGQAMLLGSDAPGGAVLCVRVQRSSPAASAEVGAMTAYPVGHLVGGPVRPVDLRVPYEESTLFPEAQEEPRPAVFDDGRLMEWLKCQVDPDTWDGAPNAMYFVDGLLFVSAPPATQSGIVDQLQVLQRLDARQFTLEVRFGDVPDDALKGTRGVDADQLAAALPHRCMSTVSASRGTQLSATWHTPYVKDFDVVIASGSAATTPTLGSIARGFLLRGDVAPMDEQTVLLDLRMSLLAHDAKGARFSLRDPRFGEVDKVDVRENKVRGATAVVLGRWTTLQLAPAEGGQGHVAVVVRLRAQ